MPPRNKIQKSLEMTLSEASQKSSKRTSRKASQKCLEMLSSKVSRKISERSSRKGSQKNLKNSSSRKAHMKSLEKAPKNILKKSLEPSSDASQKNRKNKTKAVVRRQSTICLICKRNFDSKKELNDHSKKHHFFRHCPNCPKTFQQTRKFILHLQTHIGGHPYECKICLESFNQKKEMLAHKKSHKNSVMLHCEMCSEVFPHINSLHRHQLTHDGPPYVCGYCNTVFSNIPDKTVHRLNHVYVCYICCNEVVAFPTPHKLATHMFIAHGDDKHDPNIGNAMDTLKPNLSISTVNLEDDSGSDSMEDFSSDDDDESDANMDSNYQKDAVESVYNLKRKNKFICFICYDLYPSSEELESHMKAHKWHPCNSCFRFFADAVSLEEHSCDFAAVPSFKCKICNAEIKCENCKKKCCKIRDASENNMNALQSFGATFPGLPRVPSNYCDSKERNLLYNFIDYVKSRKKHLDFQSFLQVGFHCINLQLILRNPCVKPLFPEENIPYIEDLYLKFQDIGQVMNNRMNRSSDL